MQVLDICVSAHPLKLYDIDFQGRKFLNYRGYHLVLAICLPNYVGRIVTSVGIVASYSSTTTRHGDRMKFLTLDDSTSLYNVIIWPKPYKRFGDILYDLGPFIIKGLMTKELDSSPTTVEVGWARRLDEFSDNILKG